MNKCKILTYFWKIWLVRPVVQVGANVQKKLPICLAIGFYRQIFQIFLEAKQFEKLRFPHI